MKRYCADSSQALQALAPRPYKPSSFANVLVQSIPSSENTTPGSSTELLVCREAARQITSEEVAVSVLKNFRP